MEMNKRKARLGVCEGILKTSSEDTNQLRVI